MSNEKKNLTEINKKAKNAMYIVAGLNIITAVMFWIAYKNSNENGYLIAVIVNVFSAVTILILAQILMKKANKNDE